MSEDWRSPRFFCKLRRKLRVAAGDTRVGPVCLRCRQKKIKCDGRRPCDSCSAKGLECTQTVEEIDTSEAEPSPERPIAAPSLYSKIALGLHDTTVTNRVKHPFFVRVMDFGAPVAVLNKLVSNLPPNLSSVLWQLAERMQSSPVPEFKPLEGFVLEDFTPQVPGGGRTVHALSRSGTPLGVSFNSFCQSTFGAHHEELAARVFKREMPIATSEYRMLCFLLTAIHDSIFPAKAKGFLNAVQLGCCRGENSVGLMRMLFRSVQQHGVVTHSVQDCWLIDADEYDRALEEGGGPVFMEAERSGHDLLGNGASSFMHDESLAEMQRSPRGKALLDNLTLKACQVFGLDLNAPLPPSLSPSPAPFLSSSPPGLLPSVAPCPPPSLLPSLPPSRPASLSPSVRLSPTLPEYLSRNGSANGANTAPTPRFNAANAYGVPPL